MLKIEPYRINTDMCPTTEAAMECATVTHRVIHPTRGHIFNGTLPECTAFVERQPIAEYHIATMNGETVPLHRCKVCQGNKVMDNGWVRTSEPLSHVDWCRCA